MPEKFTELNYLRADALHRAFCSYTDSLEKWQSLAQRGATNEEVIERLNHTFGLGGGTFGPGLLPEYHKGYPPRVWLGKRMPEGAPTYSGMDLVSLARQMFSIHQKVAEEQLSLFSV